MAEAGAELMRIVREIIGPMVRADGGKLYLVSVGAEGLGIHLGGRFSGCPGNTLAIRRVIEPAILSVVPGARITVSSGALIPEGAQLISD